MGAMPASADVTFCNRSDRAMLFSQRAAQGYTSNAFWRTTGWHGLPARSCTRVWTGDASKFYFWYAFIWMNNSGQLEFVPVRDTPSYFCASPQAFQFDGNPSVCPRGYTRVPYYRYETNRYHVTFSLG
jgi:uncharacterized membrane protein